MTRCEAVDPVWDRRCDKDAEHTKAAEAAARLHENDEPGDRLRWGATDDVRKAERG